MHASIRTAYPSAGVRVRFLLTAGAGFVVHARKIVNATEHVSLAGFFLCACVCWDALKVLSVTPFVVNLLFYTLYRHCNIFCREPVLANRHKVDWLHARLQAE